MTSFYTMFINIRFWVSPSMAYNLFTDPPSGFTNAVVVTLFLWAFIVIYNIMVVFHFSFIFDLKRSSNFSTWKCYLRFYITLHCHLFDVDRVWEVTGVSKESLINYSWNIFCRHWHYYYYHQHHLLLYYALQIFALKLV